MPTLNLGVIDIPYDNGGTTPKRPNKKKRKRNTAKAVASEGEGSGATSSDSTTTTQVARILEDKYGVMAAYYQKHQDDVAQAVINSLDGALESLYMGQPMPDPFAEAGQEIMAGFRMFLSTAEIEGMGVDGVPTQASIDRRSLRFKNKKSDGPRPSFVDTGTYEAAMRAWVE